MNGQVGLQPQSGTHMLSSVQWHESRGTDRNFCEIGQNAHMQRINDKTLCSGILLLDQNQQMLGAVMRWPLCF